MFKWLSINPAKALGIYDRRGSIQKQKFADFVIWKPFEIDNKDHRSGESVYKNLFLQGKILVTVVRGQIVYKDGISFQMDRN